ncbi:hypothetical protein DSECCO2_566680 [anaerobic digester metagenome]
MLKPEWDIAGSYTGQVALIIGSIVLKMGAAAKHEYSLFIKLAWEIVACERKYLPYAGFFNGSQHIGGHRDILAGGLTGSGTKSEIFNLPGPAYIGFARMSAVPPSLLYCVVIM